MWSAQLWESSSRVSPQMDVTACCSRNQQQVLEEPTSSSVASSCDSLLNTFLIWPKCHCSICPLYLPSKPLTIPPFTHDALAPGTHKLPYCFPFHSDRCCLLLILGWKLHRHGYTISPSHHSLGKHIVSPNTCLESSP